MELKQNQTSFRGTYSNLTLFFIGHKIIKYFNDFNNWNFSISLQKWNKITKHMCKSDSIFPYLQGSTLFEKLLVVHYLKLFEKQGSILFEKLLQKTLILFLYQRVTHFICLIDKSHGLRANISNGVKREADLVSWLKKNLISGIKTLIPKTLKYWVGV